MVAKVNVQPVLMLMHLNWDKTNKVEIKPKSRPGSEEKTWKLGKHRSSPNRLQVKKFWPKIFSLGLRWPYVKVVIKLEQKVNVGKFASDETEPTQRLPEQKRVYPEWLTTISRREYIWNDWRPSGFLLLPGKCPVTLFNRETEDIVMCFPFLKIGPSDHFMLDYLL